MTNLFEVSDLLPSLKTGEELWNSFLNDNNYCEDITQESEVKRLIALSGLGNIYIPTKMTTEIYNKLYVSLVQSLSKKCTSDSVRQQYENYKYIHYQNSNVILGGANSFTIIGPSGIGKSAAINKAISVITDNKIIEMKITNTKIIPILSVQCPFDCSAKGMLYEILRNLDVQIGTDYYSKANRAKATVDMLIGSVSQVAINHIGVLVIDEIQNVINNKSGNALIAAITQLINSSGISICFVGTPEVSGFFESTMFLARRTIGLYYDNMKYDHEFKEICQRIFSYQYVKNKTTINEAIIQWLYNHSNGNISIVISLLQAAQEKAILTNREKLDIEILNETYKERMIMLHGYIKVPKISQTSKTKKKNIISDVPKIEDNDFIQKIVLKAKNNNRDVVEYLKNYIVVEEIKI